MSNSNVYEERSHGIYATEAPSTCTLDRPPPGHEETQRSAHAGQRSIFSHAHASRGLNKTFIRRQLRSQLAHDAWTIVLALFLITIIEAHKFAENPAVFSVFNFLFDIVSGYGCVGISVGVPWDMYSFCGSWQTLSKVISCGVMIRGRHRGLPVAIDRAVLLAGEGEGEGELEGEREMLRHNTNIMLLDARDSLETTLESIKAALPSFKPAVGLVERLDRARAALGES